MTPNSNDAAAAVIRWLNLVLSFSVFYHVVQQPFASPSVVSSTSSSSSTAPSPPPCDPYGIFGTRPPTPTRSTTSKKWNTSKVPSIASTVSLRDLGDSAFHGSSGSVRKRHRRHQHRHRHPTFPDDTTPLGNFHAQDLQRMMSHRNLPSSLVGILEKKNDCEEEKKEEKEEDKEEEEVVGAEGQSEFEQSKCCGYFLDRDLERLFIVTRLYSGFFGITTVVFAGVFLASLYAIVPVVVAPFVAARYLFPSSPRSRFVGPAVVRSAQFFIIGCLSLGWVIVNLIVRWTCLRKWKTTITPTVTVTATATEEEEGEEEKEQEQEKIPTRVANLYLVVELFVFLIGIASVIVNDVAFLVVDVAGFETDFLQMDRVNFIYYGAGVMSICIVVMTLRFPFKVLWAVFGIVFCSLIQIPGLVRDASSAAECRACILRNFGGVLLFLVVMPVGALISQYSAEMTLRKKVQSDVLLERLLKQVQDATVRSKRILRHLIPRQFVETVECGGILLQVVRGVSAIQLDIVDFTSWCCRTDCLVVIRCLNLMFGSLDRVAKELGVLKLSQAGDAWIGVSFPRVDEDGLRALLAVARVGLVNTKYDKECDLEVRIGIGSDNGLSNGYLVCWGRRMHSLEFVGTSMDEAQELEETGTSGTVHITKQTLKMLRGDSFSGEDDDTPNTPILLSLEQVTSMSLSSEIDESLPCFSETEESEEGISSLALSDSSPALTESFFVRMSQRIWDSCSASNLLHSRKVYFVNSGVSCLVSACIFADLSMNSLASPLCIVLGLVVTLFVHPIALVNVAIMPMRFLRLTHTLFSFFILLARTAYASVVIAKFQTPSSLFIRFLVWDSAFSLLNLHIHPLLLSLAVVRIPMILILQSYLSDDVDLMSDVLELGFYAIHVLVISPLPLFYPGVSRSAEMDVKRRLKKTEEKLKRTIWLLNEKDLQAQGILDSFLPPHVLDTLSQNQSIYAERVESGGVVFVSFSLPMKCLLPKIDQIHIINEMICELDMIVSSHPSAMKIKVP